MSASVTRVKNYGVEINQQDLTRVYEYQNYRRKHVERILNAQASGEIKTSRSLVTGKRPSLDSNASAYDSCMSRSGTSKRNGKGLKPCVPVLQHLQILERGSISGANRSGLCQGGLTSSEVCRKIEQQRSNYDLMQKLSKVSHRQNSYLHNDSRSGKMMTRQTRPKREKMDLERQNLGLYLSIVNSQPKVAKYQTLMQNEKKRSRIANMVGGKINNATRVKTLANALLRQKFGSSGSHNRLFRSSKEYMRSKHEQSIAPGTPRIDPDFLSIDFPRQFSDQQNASHSIYAELERSQSRPIHQSARQQRKRPNSAVVTKGGSRAYLESQQMATVSKNVPSTASRSNQGSLFLTGPQVPAMTRQGATIPAFLTSMRPNPRMLVTSASVKGTMVESLVDGRQSMLHASQGATYDSAMQQHYSLPLDQRPSAQASVSSFVEMNNQPSVEIGAMQVETHNLQTNPTLELLERPSHMKESELLALAGARNTDHAYALQKVSTQQASVTPSAKPDNHKDVLEEIKKMQHPSIKCASRTPSTLTKAQTLQGARSCTPGTGQTQPSIMHSQHMHLTDQKASIEQYRRKRTRGGETNQSNRNEQSSHMSRDSTSKSKSTNFTRSKSSWTLQSKIGRGEMRSRRTCQNKKRMKVGHLQQSEVTPMHLNRRALANSMQVGFSIPERQSRPQSAAARHPQKSILKTKGSQLSFRNNFEHNGSRKAILKNALAEIEQEIDSV